MDVRTGDVKLICMALDRDQRRAVVKGGNEISGSIKSVLAK